VTYAKAGNIGRKIVGAASDIRNIQKVSIHIQAVGLQSPRWHHVNQSQFAAGSYPEVGDTVAAGIH
jgi:hypothetical protein